MPAAKTQRKALEAQLIHPTLRAFYDYWQTLQAGRRLPGRQHVDPLAIRPLLPWIFMIDVVDPPPDPRFRYRLAGTGIVRLYDLEFTGKTIEDAFPACAAELNADYCAVVTGRRPTHRRYPLPVPGREYRVVEHLICPLAGDGRRVDKLIGVVCPSRRSAAAGHQSAA